MALIKSIGYTIEINTNIYKSISAFVTKNKFSSYFILCDENTMHCCLAKLISNCPKLNTAQIIEIESGEASKSIEISLHIWQTLLENNADKNSLLINLGGGVVSDLGGFCASTFKRGIKFITIPTSLLAMADASVGGKTGIDFGGFKNTVGTFAQPEAVFVNPDFLSTLPKKHFYNGLAEIFKIALVCDKKFWMQLKSGSIETNLNAIIYNSILLKNKIVKKDPFDNNIRKILNFGHSIGHAIESILLETSDELLHGEAILIGMFIESHIAYQKKLLSKTELNEIVSTLKRVFDSKPINAINATSLLEALLHDKKNTKNKFLFSLPNSIGTCKINVDVKETHLKKGLDFYNNLA